MTWSRRRWLRSVLGVAGAVRTLAAQGGGLDQFGSAGPACEPNQKPTPAVAAATTYKPGAPVRARLREDGEAGTPLQLSGTVAGVKCGRIAGATVEIWHADDQGRYDASGYRHRGRQRTDANGRFAFETIVPGRSPQRARHIGVHVLVPGKTELWTELFFPDDQTRLRDDRFKPDLVLKMTSAAGGATATFDLLLDL